MSVRRSRLEPSSAPTLLQLEHAGSDGDVRMAAKKALTGFAWDGGAGSSARRQMIGVDVVKELIAVGDVPSTPALLDELAQIEQRNAWRLPSAKVGFVVAGVVDKLARKVGASAAGAACAGVCLLSLGHFPEGAVTYAQNQGSFIGLAFGNLVGTSLAHLVASPLVAVELLCGAARKDLPRQLGVTAGTQAAESAVHREHREHYR